MKNRYKLKNANELELMTFQNANSIWIEFWRLGRRCDDAYDTLLFATERLHEVEKESKEGEGVTDYRLVLARKRYVSAAEEYEYQKSERAKAKARLTRIRHR
ncbi:hypothetical protein IKE99_01425 [Candidatus Saccharibacteria bacterium]|nr:hypothetical protein [Candidatus Saccharibacteria bacterium]